MMKQGRALFTLLMDNVSTIVKKARAKEEVWKRSKTTFQIFFSSDVCIVLYCIHLASSNKSLSPLVTFHSFHPPGRATQPPSSPWHSDTLRAIFEAHLAVVVLIIIISINFRSVLANLQDNLRPNCFLHVKLWHGETGKQGGETGHHALRRTI